MATITKPIILDETGKEIVEAIKALVGGDKEHNLAYQFDAAEANIIGQYRIYNDDLYKCTAPKAAGVPFNLDGWTRVLVMEEIGSGSISISDLADEFSTTKAYNAGDLVRNESGLYKAKTNMPAGGWNPANWEPVAVRDVIVNKNDLNLKNGEGAGSIMGENATSANGANAAAFGNQTAANGLDAFATGFKTEAAGPYAYAEGNGSKATGGMSHAEGRGTIAAGPVQHVQGKYNVEDAAGKYVDIVGGGTGPEDRKNIEVTTAEGDKILKGDVYVGADDNSENGILVTKLTDFASAYENTAPYTKGDVVIYENKVYKAKDDVAAGTLPTDATKWDEIELKDTISPRAINVPIDDVDKRYDAEEVETALKEVSERTGYLSAEVTMCDGSYAFAEVDDNGDGTCWAYGYAPILELIEGETYEVTFNGTTYESVATYDSGYADVVVFGPDGVWGLYTIARDGYVEYNGPTVSTFNLKIVGKGYEKMPVELLPLKNIRDGATAGSVVEGYADYNKATGGYSHAEGMYTKATALESHAEGWGAVASGEASHAEGGKTKSTGDYTHAEGYESKATGQMAHAEGYGTIASGLRSHAEGGGTEATSYQAHAEGSQTHAKGGTSHAEGHESSALGEISHAEGLVTTAKSNYQHVQGIRNVADEEGKFADIVGGAEILNTTTLEIGPAKNIEATTWTGDKIMKGDVYVHANDDSTGGVKVVSPYDFASDYAPASTYDKGDIVIHNGGIYKAKEDGVTGDWADAKWEEIPVTDLFKPRAKDVPIDDELERYEDAEEVESALKVVSDRTGWYEGGFEGFTGTYTRTSDSAFTGSPLTFTPEPHKAYNVKFTADTGEVLEQVFYGGDEEYGEAGWLVGADSTPEWYLTKYFEPSGNAHFDDYLFDGFNAFTLDVLPEKIPHYGDIGLVDLNLRKGNGVETVRTTQATADGDFNIALGHRASATGNTSIVAIGEGATSTGGSSIAIGRNTLINNSSGIAIGNAAYALDGSGATAIGYSANARGGNSLALGTSAKANDGGVAIGNSVGARGNGAVAEGFNVNAYVSGQHVQGKYNVEDTVGLYADIVGWGAFGSGNRKNIEATTVDGDKKMFGDVYIHAAKDSTGGAKVFSPYDCSYVNFDKTQAHQVGDVCIYNGKLYKATVKKPAGTAWNTANWEEVTPDIADTSLLTNNKYSDTAAYTAGAIVLHNSKLYKAKADIPAPATGSTRPWDATKWEETNIMSNLSGANVYATDEEVDDMVDDVFGGL